MRNHAPHRNKKYPAILTKGTHLKKPLFLLLSTEKGQKENHNAKRFS